MRVFAAVADGGSLSSGGRRLGIPLASVSRKLADLEAHLGTRLFTRTTRRLEITDAGRDYLAACRPILEQVDEAERIAAGAYSEVRGQLTIAAPIVFGRLHVVPVVAEFLELHPAVDVQLRLGDRNVNLIEEHVDVALRIGTLAEGSLVARRIGRVRRVLCASPAYLARAGTPETPADLSRCSCISFDGLDASSGWMLPGTDGEKAEVRVHSRLTATTADAAIDAALLGVGITRVLEYQVAGHLRDGRLVRVLAASESAAAPIRLVHPGQGRLPMKTRAFIDFAATRIRGRLERDGMGSSSAA